MKHTLLILLFSVVAAAQDLPTLKPFETRGYYEYTTDEGREWAERLHRYLSGDSEIIGEEEEEPTLGTDGPLTEAPGDCSWYCGGGPYKITTSSYESTADSLYVPENLHDFNVLTSWTPENDKSVGAKMSFHFKPHSPRVHTIVVYNGDMKNVNQWQKHARAKKLKLYINGKPTAFLALDDEASGQAFKIEPVQSETAEDMVLTLEIVHIYPGIVYDDVVISEVNFDGLDVHCFGAGTKVLMWDGTVKNIEVIEAGEQVLTWYKNSPEYNTARVTRLVTAKHILYELKFDGWSILITDDHPIMTENGWASLNPEKSNRNYQQESPVHQLEVGDKLFIPNAKDRQKLISVTKVEGPQLSYTLELENGTNFIANGLLAKTEELRTGTRMSGITLGDPEWRLNNMGLKEISRKNPDNKTYRTANGNEFSVTVKDGKVAEMINRRQDDGGKETLLPGFLFGETTQADIIQRFGSTGFVYKSRTVIEDGPDRLFFNCYEIDSENKEILVVVTKAPIDSVVTETIVSHAKLEALLVTTATHLDALWDSEKTYGANNKKIKL